ncbi:MAG TPA: YfiR family protein [Candidatus Acidoferrum sp.]|nr:YfiR family protein [Candidatus Acidoferrum sp.]
MVSRHRDRRIARDLVIGAITAVVSQGGMVREARAESVPFELQADLMKKVVRFERGFVARCGPEVDLLLVMRDGDTRSERAAAQLAPALRALGAIAGKPVVLAVLRYSTAAALKDAVVRGRVDLIYLTPGLEPDVSAIAATLEGVPVITVAGDGGEVDHGAVLGFELVSARPRISINLGQARKQGLDFNSDLFRLARVVR